MSDSGSKSAVVPYHASRFGRTSSVGPKCSRVAGADRARRTVRGDDEIAVGELVDRLDLAAELDRNALLPAVLAQRAQQVDPRHPMEGVVGERDRFAAMDDPHRVVDLLVARDRRVELGCDVADERERDVGEDHAPAVRGVRGIALDDANAMAGIVPLHEVREEESGGPAADDADVHAASSPARALTRSPCGRFPRQLRR